MIVDTENESAEPLISPELAAELGLEEGTDLVLAGKKKKKHKSDEPSEEVKTLAKQLSKKAQKRIAQITQRKEKEAKQADFLSTIHDHEISEEHRQLLTSTRDINQSQTMKQLLSSIYKKQAAGLALSTEESQLLYNTPRRELEARFATSSLPDVPVAPEAPTESTAMEVVELHPNTLPETEQQHTLSFDDIIPQSTAADLEAFQKNKKNKKKSGNKAAAKDKSAEASSTDNVATVAPTATIVPVGNSVNTNCTSSNVSANATTTSTSTTTNTTTNTTTDTTTPTPAVSLGSGLLAQLKRIKEGNSNSSKNTTTSYKSLANAVENSTSTTTTITTDSSNNSTSDNTNATNNTTSTYTVHATALPVDAQGGIVKANTSTNNSTSASSASNKASDVSSALNKARAMGVERSAEVQAARMELPVCHMEQEIIEAIRNSANDTIILCGETGSGKSTQVPQFLYENGFGIGGMIGITQPRRVAVTSTAERVSYEMTSGIVKQEKEESSKSKKSKSKSNTLTTSNTTTNNTTTPRAGQLVGYQIRFDSSTVGADTKIKFMTDGILLKEVAQDLLLRKYRVVILDEAHERNINTDVLLGMLSKVLPLRRTQSAIEIAKYNALTPEQQLHCTLPLQPLKLIIMSATMRVNDFQNPRLFQDTMPPIIKVEARQYPVTTHFSKRTETVNYLKETHKKVCQIHKKLPEGGVLVFLSGKQEILYMCHKLARSLNKKGVKCAVGNSSGNSGGSSVMSGSTSTSGNTDTSGESSIDVVGLGASAEELMEQQEGPDITVLLNTNTKHAKHSKHNKKHTTNTATTSTDSSNTSSSDKLSMRDILNQDEIDTDSESEIDTDYSDSDSDDEGLAMNTTNTTTTTTSTSSVVPAEEEIFILDGDDNAKKRTKQSNNTVSSRISSTTSAMVTGDSVRDQLLKEALGIDPTAISSSIEDTTNTTNATTNNITSTTNNATDATEEPSEPAVPELRAYILPLYALMPAAQQNRVFLPVPPGHRLIVVATNVAETSITIPGIRYVVDSGRQKEKVMTSMAKPSEDDEQATSGSKRAFEGTAVVHKSDIESTVTNSAGIAKYEVRWVSQAAASQRSGRAGRTGPGHCYRLYSANFYHEYMKPYQPPEITVTPLEELILQMKALGIDHIERFPFPTPPPATSIKNAITLLTNLGAIAAPGSGSSTSGSSASNSNSANKKEQELSAAIAMATMQVMKSNSALHHKQLLQLQELQRQQNLVRDLCPLTQLGKVLAKFPLNPRFAKMLVMAFRSSVSTSGSGNSGNSSAVSKEKYVLLSHALTMVATLAERSAFDGVADTTSNTTSKKKARTASAEHSSDDSASEDEVTVLAKAGKNTKGSVLYYHEDGDALARLRATGAYIHTVLSAIHSTTSASAKNITTTTTTTSTNTNALYQQLSKSAVTAANESSSVRTLCSVHKLHAPTLQRIVELREQLQDISASVLLTNTNTSTNTSSTSDSNTTTNNTNTKSLLDVPLAPPSVAQELALRQLLVSGFCDCIARRVPLGVIKTGARRRRLCAYYSSHPALQDIPLYIHPGSNIYNSDPTASLPEYITYQHLVRNQRGDCVYMTCCSVVNPLWLSSVAADCPLLKWSEPILTPVPYYDSSVDSVMCYVVPKFGVNSWDLPAMRRSLLECCGGSISINNGSSEGGTPFGFRKQDEAYRWFARLLLEGNVFSPAINNSAQQKTPANSGSALSKIPVNTLKELRSALNKTKIKDSSASVVTQMKPIPKVSNLLRKLVTREVCSLSTLLSQLHSDHTYLLEEILEFVNPEHRREFRSAWAKLATTMKTSV